MKALNKILLFFILMYLPFSVFSQNNLQVKKDKMCAHMDLLKGLFEDNYAPQVWKREHLKWKIEEELQKAKEKIQLKDSITIKDYQRIVRAFFQSMHDYHVFVNFYSTETASLPFQVKGANDRYFISHVNREALPLDRFPIEIGDELVLFNGRPTSAVIQEILETEYSGRNKATDRSIAAFYLTFREGESGHDVPNGFVKIQIRHNKTSEERAYDIRWNYKPEMISNAYKGMEGFDHQEEGDWERHFFVPGSHMEIPFFSHAENSEAPDSYYDNEGRELHEAKTLMGSRNSFVPKLGKIVWESESKFFYAYAFELEKNKLVGYVRIPHYNGGNAEASEFRSIIRFFEDKTEALIVDQVDNSGGYMQFMMAIASILSQRPLQNQNHQYIINQQEVLTSVREVDFFRKIKNETQLIQGMNTSYFCGMRLTFQYATSMLNYHRFIIGEWNAGRTLTHSFPYLGIEQIPADPEVNYSKPILVLINNLNISCADFFPALMQDNRRAVLFGETTSGAGGMVKRISFPNPYGIKSFSYTSSLVQRPDKSQIEDLGVQPDIPYAVSEGDLQYGYSGYAQAVLDSVKRLISLGLEGVLREIKK